MVPAREVADICEKFYYTYIGVSSLKLSSIIPSTRFGVRSLHRSWLPTGHLPRSFGRFEITLQFSLHFVLASGLCGLSRSLLLWVVPPPLFRCEIILLTFRWQVVFGTIVTRGPRSALASNAMSELDQACLLFSKAAVHSRRAAKALVSVPFLRDVVIF